MHPLVALLLILLAAVALGYAAILVLLLRSYGRSLPTDEEHRVPTSSGWDLALHRLRPAPDAPPRATPVILGHGTAMSRQGWHMSEGCSLARHLAARGHDVWIPEYRGAGDSRYRGTGRRPWAFSIDEHVREDLPALIERVCELSGAERVSWVGHSLGGIVIYGYCQENGTDRLDRVVTIGSPAAVGKARALHVRAACLAFRLLIPGWRLPLHNLTRLSMPLCVYFKRWLMAFFCNPALTREAETAALLARGVQDMPNDLLRQYAGWLTCARMEMRDGTRLEDAVDAVDVPLLVLGGAADQVVPARSVRPAYERSPAEHKAFRIFGSAGDPAPAMGHVDPLITTHGAAHVFPVVEEWLERDFDAGQSSPS